MTKVSSYAFSRQIALLFGILALLAVPIVVVSGFFYKSGFGYLLLHLPLVFGISLVMSQLLFFSLFVRSNPQLPKAEKRLFHDFFPVSLGLLVSVCLLLFLYSAFVLPTIVQPVPKGVKSADLSFRKKERFPMPGYKKPDVKLIKQGIEHFYRAEYRKAVIALRKYYKVFPDNYFAAVYLQFAKKALARRGKMRFPGQSRSKLLQQALRSLQKEAYYQAIDKLAKVLERSPNNKRVLRYMKQAREGLNRSSRKFGKVDRLKGLRIRIELALARAIKFFKKKQYWTSYVALRDILMLDPFNAVGLKYHKLCRDRILRFDFFYEDFLSLYLYPVRYNLFFVLGKGWYLAVQRMFDRSGDWFARRLVLLSCEANGSPRKLFYAEYGKWIGKKLVMRRVREIVFDGMTLKPIDRSYVVAPVSSSPGELWLNYSVFFRQKQLSPGDSIALVPAFEKVGLPTDILKISFVRLFVFPVAIFSLALFVAGSAWRYRMKAKTFRKWVVTLFLLGSLPIVYLVLIILARIVLASELAVASTPLLSYLVPLGISLLMGGLAFFSLPLHENKK